MRGTLSVVGGCRPDVPSDVPSGKATRSASVVRGITAALALLSVACSLYPEAIVGGSPGFGFAQRLVLALGVVMAVFVFLPIRYAKRLLLALGSLGVAAGAGEIGIRLFLADWYASLYVAHPRYIFTSLPHARSQHMLADANGGKSVVTQINSEGFRGPELRTGSPCRIAVYGDSYVMARFTNLEDTFPVKLERLLETRIPGIEVVNAGIQAYGPDQVALKMEDDLPRLRPQVVVLALCGNDCGDLLRNKLFKLDANGALRPNVPRLSDRLRRDLVGANSDPLLVKAFAKFRRRFEPRTPLTTEDDLAECRREYLSYVVEGSDEVTNLFSDQLDSDIRTDPDGDSARYKKRFLAAVLARIRETVSRHGAPLVVLVIPAAVDVCDTYDARDVDPRKHPAYRRSALTDTLVEAAAAAGIPAVDLYPIFRAEGGHKYVLHGGDSHWNAAGQAVAAERMAAYLTANGLVR